MRIIVTLTILTASLALGGCFHHGQTYAEAVPPPVAHPPIK